MLVRGLKLLSLSLISAVFGGAVHAAGLPAVDLSRGVSAHALFGEIPAQPVNKAAAAKTTTARAATGDVLQPQKPADNLWAKNSGDTTPIKFAANKNEYLPPESLKPIRSATAQPAPKIANVARPNFDDNVARSFDAELSKMIAAKRAEEVAAAKPVEVAVAEPAPAQNTEPKLAVRSMVVPMDDIAPREPVKTERVDDDRPLTAMTPAELKRAFQKTYVSENRHLSAYSVSSDFDTVSSVSAEGFYSAPDLSAAGGIRPLEIKIGFRGDDANLSRDNYGLLSEYAALVVANPKNAVQISIPERTTRSFDGRKLTAKRLAIIEQVLRDNGISEARIIPVLADRSDDALVLRRISTDQYQTLSEQQRDAFGDTVSTKTSKSLSW